MNRLRLRLLLKEEGQSIVLVALLLFFVFLVFAALATDGTLIYLHRRKLQNIADSAALAAAVELSQNKDDAVAYQEAMDTIAANGGRIEWYSTGDPPNPMSTPAITNTNVGSGLDLVMGIEITNSCDVRVALSWNDVGTYFTQFVGRELLQVGARAHAGCNKAGGLMPIAVKRFGDEFDWDDGHPGPNTKKYETVYCEECDTSQSLLGQGNDKAHDFLRPEVITSTLEDDVITQWPTGTLIYQSPAPHADLASGAAGREYFILAGGVTPNVANGASFAGPVNLDLRQLTSFPTGYNGVPVDANSNTLKDYIEWYIRRGYCCDIPKPGDQVAVIAGDSVAFTTQAFQETYNVGDVVAVIVYDGHVHRNPELILTGDDPNYKATYPTTSTLTSNTLVYTFTLEGGSGFKSSPHGLTMAVEGLDGFADYSKFFPDDTPAFGQIDGINQHTLTLHVTPTLTTTIVGTATQEHVITGTRMFYVSAIDDKVPGGTGIRRYWTGIATIGDYDESGNQRDLPSVTTEPDSPFIIVAKGDPPVTIQLKSNVWGIEENQTATISPGALPTGFSWRTPEPDWTSTIKWNKTPGDAFNIKLEVDETAVHSSNPYVIPLTVSVPGMKAQTFNLYVLVQEANITSKDYVVILGYAALEVMEYPGVNSVRGRIVSKLMIHPSELMYGLRARLIPWEQL